MDSQNNQIPSDQLRDLNSQQPIPFKKTFFKLSLFIVIILILILIFGIIILNRQVSKTNNRISSIIQTPTQITPSIQKINITNQYFEATPPAGKLYCQFDKLGFLIEYPDYMICDQGNYTLIKRISEKSALAPEIIIQPIDKMYIEFDTFEKNILKIASQLCEGNGPMQKAGGKIVMGGSSCPEKYITLRKFKNKNNIDGYNIQRKMIFEAEGEILWERQETVIFYKIDASDNFAVMLSTDTHSTDPDIPNNLNKELLEISDSFRFIK